MKFGLDGLDGLREGMLTDVTGARACLLQKSSKYASKLENEGRALTHSFDCRKYQTKKKRSLKGKYSFAARSTVRHKELPEHAVVGMNEVETVARVRDATRSAERLSTGDKKKMLV